MKFGYFCCDASSLFPRFQLCHCSRVGEVTLLTQPRRPWLSIRGTKDPIVLRGDPWVRAVCGSQTVWLPSLCILQIVMLWLDLTTPSPPIIWGMMSLVFSQNLCISSLSFLFGDVRRDRLKVGVMWGRSLWIILLLKEHRQ